MDIEQELPSSRLALGWLEPKLEREICPRLLDAFRSANQSDFVRGT